MLPKWPPCALYAADARVALEDFSRLVKSFSMIVSTHSGFTDIIVLDLQGGRPPLPSGAPVRVHGPHEPYLALTHRSLMLP
jgi:hypothetical protein